MLGTDYQLKSEYSSAQRESVVLMNPSFGLAESGSAISALIPQTIVVSPILINADPSAVDTDPNPLAPHLLSRMGCIRTDINANIPPSIQLSSVRSVTLSKESTDVFVGM
jgi:hypothetical protein